jgi:hypothetical protein
MNTAFPLTPNLSRPTVRMDNIIGDTSPTTTPPADLPRPSIPSMVPPEVETTHHNTLIPMEARTTHLDAPSLFSKPIFNPPAQQTPVSLPQVPVTPQQPQITMPDMSLPHLPPIMSNRVNSTPQAETPLDTRKTLIKHRLIDYFIPLDSNINNPYDQPKRKQVIISIKCVGLLILVLALYEFFSQITSLNRYVFLEVLVLLFLVGIFLFIGENLESFDTPHNPYRLRS